MADAVVSVKVKAEDQASSVLRSLSEGFNNLSNASKAASAGFVSLAKQTISTAVGIKLADITSGIGSLWTDAIGLAKTHNAEIRQMASILMMTGKAGAGWPELVKQAEYYKGKIQEVAIETGSSKDAMISAFEHLTERSQKPPDQIMKIVENMAVAARVVPGGVEGMVAGFQAMELGVIRPRNEIVMLIRQAGLMKGSAREIAHDLMAMGDAAKLGKATPEVQKLAKEFRDMGRDPVMALTEKAIATMAERAKGVPMTMSQVIASLKESKTQILETAGLPILRGLLDGIRPPLESLRKYLSTHRAEIEAWARTAGEKVGIYVSLAADKIREGFQYLQTHAAEIKNALSIGATMLMNAMRFIANNKEIFLALAGLRVLGGAGGVGVARYVGEAGISTIMKGMETAKAAAAAGAVAGKTDLVGRAVTGMGLTGTGASMVGAGIGLAAFAAAIAAVGAAAYNAAKYLEESKGFISPWASLANDNAQAILEAMDKMVSDSKKTMKPWSKEETAWYEDRKKAALSELAASGKTASEVEAVRRRLEAGHKSHLDSQAKLASLELAKKRLDDMKRVEIPKEFVGPSPLLGAQMEMASQIQDMYNLAAQTGDQGMFEYLAKFVSTNENAANALLSAGALTGAGFDAFIAVLESQSPALAAALRAAGQAAASGGAHGEAAKPKGGGGSGAQKPMISFRIETFQGGKLAVIGPDGVAVPITARTQTFAYPVSA